VVDSRVLGLEPLEPFRMVCFLTVIDSWHKRLFKQKPVLESTHGYMTKVVLHAVIQLETECKTGSFGRGSNKPKPSSD